MPRRHPTGITKRHSKRCSARSGGRCDCNAGWEAWVYLPREDRKVRRTFRQQAEAKAWRADTLGLANRGTLRAAGQDTRTVADALDALTDGMADGTVRPRGRRAYKPATVRSYQQGARVHLIPALGRFKVTDLRRSDVQAFADELLADGAAPSTVANALAPLQALYRRLKTATRSASTRPSASTCRRRRHGAPGASRPRSKPSG